MMLRRDAGEGTRGKEDPTIRKGAAEGREALRPPPSLFVCCPPRAMAERFNKTHCTVHSRHREARGLHLASHTYPESPGA